MAKEIRRLAFTYNEAMAALKALAEKNNINLPHGRIVRTQFAGNSEYELHPLRMQKSDIQSEYNIKDSPKSAILTIFCDETLEQKYLNLTANFISTALIEYCIAHKIMLPKQSEKSLDFSDFSICLDIYSETTIGDDSPKALSLED